MTTDFLLSADSHIVEPAAIWEGLPAVVGTELPSYDAERASWAMGDGRVAVPTVVGRPASPFDTTGRDRLEAQSRDGLSGEVLYPSPDLWAAIAGVDGSAYSVACAGAYNDWLGDFCGADRDRLIGVAVLPTASAAEMASELRRCGESLHLRAAVLQGWPDGRPGPIPADDALWEVAEALKIPISVHAGFPQWIDADAGETIGAARATSTFRAAPALVHSGVFDRFPGLRLVLAHGNAGWLPGSLQTGDELFIRTSGTRNQPSLGNPDWLPSDYLHHHVWVTFHRDRYAVINRDLIGTTNLLWGCGAPLAESDWPNDRAQAAAVTEETVAADAAALLGGNCARLYHLASFDDFSDDELEDYQRLILI